jgi:hypothetical protein
MFNTDKNKKKHKIDSIVKNRERDKDKKCYRKSGN